MTIPCIPTGRLIGMCHCVPVSNINIHIACLWPTDRSEPPSVIWCGRPLARLVTSSETPPHLQGHWGDCWVLQAASQVPGGGPQYQKLNLSTRFLKIPVNASFYSKTTFSLGFFYFPNTSKLQNCFISIIIKLKDERCLNLNVVIFHLYFLKILKEFCLCQTPMYTLYTIQYTRHHGLCIPCY